MGVQIGTGRFRINFFWELTADAKIRGHPETKKCALIFIFIYSATGASKAAFVAALLAFSLSLFASYFAFC